METQQKKLARGEIYERVRKTVSEEQYLDLDEITPNAKLVYDLGMDSLAHFDMLISFERRPNIKIPKEELFPALSSPTNLPPYLERQTNRYTFEEVEELKRKCPHVDFTDFKRAPSLNALIGSVTINSLVNYLERRMGETQNGN